MVAERWLLDKEREEERGRVQAGIEGDLRWPIAAALFLPRLFRQTGRGKCQGRSRWLVHGIA